MLTAYPTLFHVYAEFAKTAAGGCKTAADVSETSLEQQFADLASSRLRDKCPALMDYLVGFQMLDSDDDGSRAAGIYGFEIGGSWYYVPVFFLNGEIRGMDSIFCDEQNLFVPLNEKQTDKIINRKPARLGNNAPMNRGERGVRDPDYTRMRVLPGGTPAMGANDSIFGMGKTAADATAYINRKMAAERQYIWTPLDKVASEVSPVICKSLCALLRHHKVASAFREHYSLGNWNVELKPREKVAAESKKDDKVFIISQIGMPGVEELNDEQKEQVMAGETVVIDHRGPNAISQVYTTIGDLKLENPREGGLYDVLFGDGSVRKILVMEIAGKKRFGLFDPENRHYGEFRAEEIYTTFQYAIQEFGKELEKVSVECSAIRPGQTVLFVSNRAIASVPWCVEDVRKGVDDIISMPVNDRYTGGLFSGVSIGSFGSRDDLAAPVLQRAPWNAEPISQRIKEVLVSDIGGNEPRYTFTQMLVNRRAFRGVVLNSFSKKRSEGSNYEYESYDKPPETLLLSSKDLGDHNTVRAAIEKVAYTLKVFRGEGEIVIDEPNGRQHSLGKTAALGHLMRKHGMCHADAETVIRGATREAKPVWVRAKVAAQFVDFMQPDDRSESGFMSTLHPQEQHMNIPTKATPVDNRDYYGYTSPFAGGDDADQLHDQVSEGKDAQQGGDKTFDTINRASQIGQREVFDCAVLSRLIEAHNAPDLVERYLPTIISGMDRLGRLLFLIHWHYQEFRDRWGKEDLTEFIDNVGSTFESLGDIVDFGSRKTLSGDPESYGLGLNNLEAEQA